MKLAFVIGLELIATFIRFAGAAEITLKGTCDNYLKVYLAEDGVNYQSIDSLGWSGDLNDWQSINTLTLDINDFTAKLKLRCENIATDTQAGGLLFSVGYDGEWYSTGSDYFELMASKSGKMTAYSLGETVAAIWNTGLGNGANWVWTCTPDDGWNCGVSGEYNEYIFDFANLDPCVGVSCSDGLICNGEEYCDSTTGDCVDGAAIECPNDFVCDNEAQGCVRDCTTFAIDGYLRDCSAEFDSNEIQLAALEGKAIELESNLETLGDEVGANTDDIATNKEAIASNADRISSNEELSGGNAEAIGGLQADVESNKEGIESNGESIESNEESIGALEESVAECAEKELFAAYAESTDERLEALEARLLGYSPVADEGEGTGENQLNSPNEVETSESGSSSVFGDFYWITDYKGEWIVALLIVNIVLCLCLIHQGCSKEIGLYGQKKKYSAVQMYSSADDENVGLQQRKP